jgi:hypothetical protein
VVRFVGTVATVFALFLLLLVLYAIVRFAIISPRKMKGAKGRLRDPDAENIGKISGIYPSAELVAFYRQAPFIEEVEFYLVDRSKEPAVSWFVGAFNPLTAPDVRERKKISGVPGIPIADDMDKGTYFVGGDGRVMLRSPNIPGREIEVAPDITSFSNFERADNPQNDALV